MGGAMLNQYKVTISNNKLYKEIDLPIDAATYSIGTTVDSDYRLRREFFFSEIKLEFVNDNGNWSIMCSEKIYISLDDARKMLNVRLNHGDGFDVKYQDSNNTVFRLEFGVDFDSKVRNYERKIDISNNETVLIGTNKSSNIIIKSEYLFNDSIELRKNGKDYDIIIRNLTYGLYVNGNKIDQNCTIKNGNFFAISDYSFYLKDGALWTEANSTCAVNGLSYKDYSQKNNYPLFNRNTRVRYKIDTEAIPLLVPPAEPKKPDQNIALTLLPALGMIGLTIVVRGFMSNVSNYSFIIFSVCSMTMGIITSIVTFFSNKKKYKKEIDERISQYNRYIDNKKVEIENYRDAELDLLNKIYYSIEEDINTVMNFSPKLFDKNKEDEDFLSIYLGEGTTKALKPIDFKKQETFKTNDTLAGVPDYISETYDLIDNAPIFIGIRDKNVVGIVGDNDDLYNYFKNVLVDLLTRHYYLDVKFVCLLEEDYRKYEWIKNLPHIINNDGFRNLVYDQDSRNLVFESIYKELTFRSSIQNCQEFEHIIIFVLKEWGIKNHPLSQFMQNASQLNVTFIYFENATEDLPMYCSEIVSLNKGSGLLQDTHNGTEEKRFDYKIVKDQTMYKICEILAPVYCDEISLESSLRKSISLFELMKIYAVEDIDLKSNWENAQIYNSMAAPLGVNSKNEVVYLDLHEKAHGPHGLVAGTTGSGKSEILQTFILTASSLFHPYELGFMIIDFKGGGMVNQFKDLPHLIGAITNIDGKEINRSLKSIKAELLKRQTLFAEAGVNQIDKYIKLFREGKVSIALPHLIIIVDEFAELKADQPEFMKELISAARIGRSLGVHLILATQKPSGQVNEQIWSNSKFKLCLKVQTIEDSNEVLKSPLAAEIKEPGRAYLQVGNNEMFELLQSGYSGAPENSDDINETTFGLYEVDFGGRRRLLYKKQAEKHAEGITQLEAVVKYINKYCKENGINSLPSICLPSLGNMIEVDESIDIKDMNHIPVGIYDDPDTQFQGACYLDFCNENTLVIGSAATGKTNLLQLIIRQLSSIFTPRNLNIYIMDFGSMYLKNFESLKHIGGVVTVSEEDRIKNLFKLITESIESRKNTFLELGISSYKSYIDAGYSDYPHILLMIDNFAVFKELYSESYEDDLIYMTREGLSYGISVIVTNPQTSGMGYKYLANFSKHISFHCNDSGEYSVIFDRCRMEPNDVSGRALCMLNKEIYEMQTFVAFEGEKEIDRSKSIKDFITRINATTSETAKLIPSVPEMIDYNYININYEISKDHFMYPIGLRYSDIDVEYLDLNKCNELCIVGNDTGKRKDVVFSLFNVFDYYSLTRNIRVQIIDNYTRELKILEDNVYVEKYTVDYSVIESVLEGIEAELENRFDIIKDSGIEGIKGKDIIILVINNTDVINFISSNKTINDLYSKIINQYKSLGCFVLFSCIDDSGVQYSAPELIKKMRDRRKAIITTTNPRDIKYYDLSLAMIRELKSLKRGEYFALNGNDIERIKLIEEV